MYGFVYTTCLGECMFKRCLKVKYKHASSGSNYNKADFFFLQYSIDTRWNILVDIND